MTQGHPDTPETRRAVIDACRWMNARGINQGTSGNISVRTGPEGQDMLITPSGIPYDALTPEMIVRMPIEGEPDMGGALKPSSEWRFHQRLLRSRADMAAVVHAHPVHATALSVLHAPIPPCHYMIAAFGGTTVPLVDYHLFGSETLAEEVSRVMSDHHGCLMANHGALVVGETLERALWRMEELETLARVYLVSRQAGEPKLLSAAQIAEVAVSFASYGPGRAD